MYIQCCSSGRYDGLTEGALTDHAGIPSLYILLVTTTPHASLAVPSNVNVLSRKHNTSTLTATDQRTATVTTTLSLSHLKQVELVLMVLSIFFNFLISLLWEDLVSHWFILVFIAFENFDQLSMLLL